MISFRTALMVLFWVPLTLFAQVTDEPADKPVTVESNITPGALQGVQRNGNHFYAAGKRDSLAATGAVPQDLHLQIYRQAASIRDYHTAAYALWDFLLRNPNHTEYKDTLIGLYYYSGNYTSVIMLARQVLDDNPEDVFAWEYSALTYQMLGKTLEALEAYEEVYKRIGGNYYLYQIAGLQYSYDRNRECLESIHALLESDKLKDETIELTQGQLRETVAMEAAVYNLKGNLHHRQGDTAAARAAFEKALEISPDFTLAKNNLQALK